MQPESSSRWLTVDGAAAYMGGVSRKTVYAAVADGMRVSRLSAIEPRRDSRGRLNQGRMLFCREWIDSFVESRATRTPLQQREVTARKSLSPQQVDRGESVQIATGLQQSLETTGSRA
jgi:hypothetical protein